MKNVKVPQIASCKVVIHLSKDLSYIDVAPDENFHDEQNNDINKSEDKNINDKDNYNDNDMDNVGAHIKEKNRYEIFISSDILEFRIRL